MCGICGIVRFDGKPVEEKLLREMNDLLFHRGPDSEGIYISRASGGPQAGLAMRRLKIIDLETGNQPIFNEDKTLSLVFNGEIYNFRELRKELEKRHVFNTKSDTETILHLYEDHGTACLDRLRGMFAFALWDGRKKELFLARDRMGKKPLCYTWMDGNFYFSSEMKSFLKVPAFKKNINLSALNYYLTYQYIPSPMTIWPGVFRLEPASFMVINREGKTRQERYWDIDLRPKTRMSFGEAKSELRNLLKEAVEMRMIADVPLGAFLSGGHDSSIIVGLMSGLSSQPVKTFSIGFKEERYSELEYARIVAKHFHTEHNEFIVEPKYFDILPRIVWHYDQPYADCSALPSYYVAKMTRQHVTVALNGDGGDENFAGYLRYKALNVSKWIHPFVNAVPDFMMDSFLKLFPEKESSPNRKPWHALHRFVRPLKFPPERRNLIWHAYFTNELKDYIFSEKMKKTLAGEDVYPYLEGIYRNAPAENMIDRTLYSDLTAYLPEDLLVKMDIASMAHSLEARSPFLDHRFVEFAAALPPSWKIRGLNTKYILKEAFRDMLPPEIFRRGKQGFSIPLGQWFRTDWKNYTEEILFSGASRGRGYFDAEHLKTIVSDHVEGRKDYGYCLWALLMLELWHLVFIDGTYKI
ncbi:MAG TPA: asparagine synthase (glutamine-hydrolyzing) [bacterium]|nr:asparagine synthase (glutamine-hydrolyzing) [bacterium]